MNPRNEWGDQSKDAGRMWGGVAGGRPAGPTSLPPPAEDPWCHGVWLLPSFTALFLCFVDWGEGNRGLVLAIMNSL